MIQRCLFFVAIIFAICACETNDIDDYLTNGTWVLDKGLFSTSNETLKFNTNGTYLIASELNMPQQLFPTKAVTGSISGNYNRNGNKINFLSSKVDFPVDSSSFYSINNDFNAGNPFGMIYRWIQNDSLLSGLDSLNFSGIGDREIVPSDGAGKWSWQILNLTNDSLKVESNRIAIKYYKQ